MNVRSLPITPEVAGTNSSTSKGERHITPKLAAGPDNSTGSLENVAKNAEYAKQDSLR